MSPFVFIGEKMSITTLQLAEKIVRIQNDANLVNPWRGDHWPAGWNSELESLLVSAQGPIEPLLEIIPDLTVLMRTTLGSALLRLNKATREQMPLLNLLDLCNHCVCQIEFEGRDLRRFFYMELDTISDNWPEEEWRPALVKAASSTVNMNYDVWPPVINELVPWASPAQLVQIAFRHSCIDVEPGMNIYNFEKAMEVLHQDKACFFELEKTLTKMTNMVSSLAIQTFGYALLCLENNKKYPNGKSYHWSLMIQYPRYHKYIKRILKVMPDEYTTLLYSIYTNDLDDEIPETTISDDEGNVFDEEWCE